MSKKIELTHENWQKNEWKFSDKKKILDERKKTGKMVGCVTLIA